MSHILDLNSLFKTKFSVVNPLKHNLPEDTDSEDEEAYFMLKTQGASQETSVAVLSEYIFNPPTPLELELARFTNHNNVSNEVPHDVNVLKWWKNHEKIYPLIAKGVKKYMAIQATSCANENTFSIGSNTLMSQMPKLDPQNVQMLAFCNENLKRMKFKFSLPILEAGARTPLQSETESMYAIVPIFSID